ncbi:MAG: class I SAM-dependent methyltransferase [Terriglobia bacterium]
MPPDDSDVQNGITTFWSTVAPSYDSFPGNVPGLESAEHEAWVRAMERLLPPQPADVLDVGTGTGFVALIASRLGHRAIGLDLSTAMLAEARAQADQRGLKATFRIGDAVAPSLDEASLDAIVCRHFLWTLREPEVALGNWRRLLRPNGRVVVIDGFWFAQSKPEPEKGADLFERYYTNRTREALPAMRWESVEPVAKLLVTAGFSEVTVSDLADIHRLAQNPPSPQPWYVVTGRRN